MTKAFVEQYIVDLFHDVPLAIYAGLLATFFVFSIPAFVVKGFEAGKRICAKIMLVEYIFLLLCSTVFFRESNGVQEHQFRLFWSYSSRESGMWHLMLDNVLNILVFLPIGFLQGMAFKDIKWQKVIVVGLAISTTIEMSQYTLNRGCAEIDDIMHNVVGCMLGYSLYKAVYYIKNYRINSSTGNV